MTHTTSAFTALFDYAGLFPPAGLDMPEAVCNFGEYLEGDHQHMLNTFVVPAGRLEEFSAARRRSPSHNGTVQLSVLSRDWTVDAPLIDAFRSENTGVNVASVETRFLEAAADVLKCVDYVYVELTPGPELSAQLEALKNVGAFAKLRTGGLTTDAFPSCDTVAEFIVSCIRYDVSFKATAGLHHPVWSNRHTCADPNAPLADMHGFVNVLAAVAAATEGAPVADVASILQQTDVAKLFGAVAEDESTSRARQMFHSIGSCSFVEPVEDLQELGWL